MFSHDTFTSLFGTPRPGELDILPGLIRAALREGYAVVLNEPGTKKPLCPLTAAARRKADREVQDAAAATGDPRATQLRHACGVHHALGPDDAAKVTGLLKRLTETYGAVPNIGLEPGRSRLLAVDVDTATERDAFFADWAAETGTADAPPDFTVLSPGVRRTDANGGEDWVHRDGGHFWFTLPVGLELPAGPGGAGVMKADSGWTAVWAGRQVLVPPSVREEGPYQLVASPTPAPQWLLDRVYRYVEGRAERERIRLERQVERRAQGDVDPVDIWSSDTPWAELLEPDGWTATGLVDTCTCPTWTAPGPHGSPKSATAHGIGCTIFDTDDGHAPLHIWTDNPPDYLAGAGRHITRLTYVAHRDHGGSESDAVIALGLALASVDRDEVAALDEFQALLDDQSTSSPHRVDGDSGEPGTEDSSTEVVPAGLAKVVSEPTDVVNHDQEDAPSPWYDWTDLGLIPPPDPMISGVLDHRTMTVLAGKFGTYKTFLALDWAASLATGTPWAGHQVIEPVPVVYVAAEGVGSFDRRLAAWQHGHGGLERARGMLTIHHGPVDITKNEPASQLFGRCKDTGAKLLIIDTLSRCAPGLEENDAKSMAAALERLFMIRDALGIAILVLHHTGHQGLRARGSSVLEDNADASWVVRLNGGEGEDRGPEIPRTLMHRKSKDGELLTEKPMALMPVGPQHGGSAFLSFDAFDAPVSGGERRAAESQAKDHELATEIREIFTKEGRVVGRETLAAMLDLPAGNKTLRRALMIAKETWSITPYRPATSADQLNNQNDV